MKMTRIPEQISASGQLVRSWSVDHPKFYGLKVTDRFVAELLDTEKQLQGAGAPQLDPNLCRVLAAYHGPKGAKVPLSTSTVSGCVRPSFVAKNPWLSPGAMSCYNGGCYLFHARAIPAKKDHEVKVRAHTTPADGLIAAGRLSRHFGVPIRDNQSSDGSLSMVLPGKGGGEPQLLVNLRTLCESGLEDVPYLCFSAAYTKVSNQALGALSEFPNLVVHLTVSGWHSTGENILRLNEFERYKRHLPTVCLRVVNRQDWACGGHEAGDVAADDAARCEGWLLEEISKRGFEKNVIRTPFHSVHPFPGSRTGNLGSRHLAMTDYSEAWPELLQNAAGECCTTGKCKSCPTSCGVNVLSRPQAPGVAARALEAMYWFEVHRQDWQGGSALGSYTARMLARKAMEQYSDAGDNEASKSMSLEYNRWGQVCAKENLTKLQRRRLANDSHALVVDGLDRHGLWKKALK